MFVAERIAFIYRIKLSFRHEVFSETRYMHRAPGDAIMRVRERKREGDNVYAYLRDPNELDRPRHQERQGQHTALRQVYRSRRQTRSELRAGLLDRGSL